MQDPQLMHVAADQMSRERKKTEKHNVESLKKTVEGNHSCTAGELGNCVLEAVQPTSSQMSLRMESEPVCVSCDT